MFNTHSRSIVSVASLSFLFSLILLPFSDVSAMGYEAGRRAQRSANSDAVRIQINSIDTVEEGEIIGHVMGTLLSHPSRAWGDDTIQKGDEINMTFTTDTSIFMKMDEVGMEDLTLGQRVFVLGTWDAQIDELTAVLVTGRAPKSIQPFAGEIIQADTNGNWIIVRPFRTQDQGDDYSHYLYVTYDDATEIMEDNESAEETALNAGDKIRIRGDWSDSESYLLDIDASAIRIFDELHPRRHWSTQQGR